MNPSLHVYSSRMAVLRSEGRTDLTTTWQVAINPLANEGAFAPVAPLLPSRLVDA